ncbi:MAG: UDP-N-acetylmuramoyl-L-alanine--D-glutamate ligase [Bacilli bacterium]|nr:UDP-N-acetylmuramoyl-L-alanine--D-glutamate ligase [Bacilli bacterium]
MNLTEYNNKLKSSKIAILGLGVSNIPLLEYLHNLGCDVVVFNTKPLDKNLIDKLNIYKIKYYNEENAFDYLHGFDIIFRSPSILPTRKELVIAKEEGAVITSEIRELLHLAPCKVIGVTGSDGKTTTTTLINEILKANSYHTFLGGNIGTPLFTKLPEMKKEDIIVLELSSFQLMDMDISPDISIITNIAENHLDIHSSFEEYIDAKKNIFKYQDNKGILVTNADNEITNKFKGNGETRYFSRSKQTNYFYTDGTYIYYNGKKILNKNDIKLRGIHNLENIATALTAVIDLIDLDKSIEVIKNFNGVEHRLEFVREINNVKWYNDSVSSSPTRTIAGLYSYDENIVLIAGGYDKHLDYTNIAKPILDKVTKLILMGDTKEKIYNAVTTSVMNPNIEIYKCNTLQEVVDKAKEVAIPGEIVLFSPASASFDMFKNFADRGNQFKDLVNKLK